MAPKDFVNIDWVSKKNGIYCIKVSISIDFISFIKSLIDCMKTNNTVGE